MAYHSMPKDRAIRWWCQFREFRRENHLTQEEMAREMKLTTRAIQYLEAGKVRPFPMTRLKFAELRRQYRAARF